MRNYTECTKNRLKLLIQPKKKKKKLRSTKYKEKLKIVRVGTKHCRIIRRNYWTMHKGQKGEEMRIVEMLIRSINSWSVVIVYLDGFSRAKISRKIRLEGEREVRVVNQKTGRSVGPQSLISCMSVIYTVTVYVHSRDCSSTGPSYLLTCLVIFPSVERSKINKHWLLHRDEGRSRALA